MAELREEVLDRLVAGAAWVRVRCRPQVNQGIPDGAVVLGGVLLVIGIEQIGTAGISTHLAAPGDAVEQDLEQPSCCCDVAAGWGKVMVGEMGVLVTPSFKAGISRGRNQWLES